MPLCSHLTYLLWSRKYADLVVDAQRFSKALENPKPKKSRHFEVRPSSWFLPLSFVGLVRGLHVNDSGHMWTRHTMQLG